MWPTRASGTSSSTASSIPSPARSTGTTTTSAPIRRPGAGPSGVSTVTSVGRHIAQRFGREQHADARRRAPKMFRRRVLVAQRHQRVVHERMIDEVNRHGAHYTQSGR